MKLNELELGVVYKCKLSDRKVLITDIVDQTFTTEEGRTIPIYRVLGSFYNKVTGYIETDNVMEDQLEKL